MAGPGQLCGELAACGIRGANWANWANYSFMDVSWMFHASLGDFESSFHRTICHSYLRWSVFYQGTSRKHREYRTKERKSQCCHIFIILHISYILVFIFPHCDRAGHRLGSWVLPVELTCPDPRTTCGISVVLVYCQG